MKLQPILPPQQRLEFHTQQAPRLPVEGFTPADPMFQPCNPACLQETQVPPSKAQHRLSRPRGLALVVEAFLGRKELGWCLITPIVMVYLEELHFSQVLFKPWYLVLSLPRFHSLQD